MKYLVWEKVRPCTDQVSLSASTNIKVEFGSSYDWKTGIWRVDVSSKTPAVTFGRWQVLESTGEVTPDDEVARNIASPSIICDQPVSSLAVGKTPPLFLAATPTPELTPTPTPVVNTPEEAQLRVWVDVFNCYRHWPESTAFTAYYGETLQRWIVEGKTESTFYGVWLVDPVTGDISPWDSVAKQATDKCAPTSVVATGAQASLKVWVAIYSCFDPRPDFSSLAAYQESPQRWVVEGRSETDDYGLWLVATYTAVITPWDDIARTTAAKVCYKKL